jgi:hypothetical protein
MQGMKRQVERQSIERQMERHTLTYGQKNASRTAIDRQPEIGRRTKRRKGKTYRKTEINIQKNT